MYIGNVKQQKEKERINKKERTRMKEQERKK
jgi:hypothetical protein